jgi:hypothetical protein
LWRSDAQDREELAMLAHESWLAKRMQLSRTGGHRTDVPRELPDV